MGGVGLKWVEKKGKAKGKGWRIFSDAEFYFSIVSFSKLGGFFFMSVIYSNKNKSKKNWKKTDRFQNQNF